ncbi:hypothetical protein D9758_018628 [Tetrapyrgos nigripes]|uniref:FAD-binding FR-type domain-containing protein n=1 Tax=Tetrapyrgos nigripes TaxID=182062 RepID=A0A8H5EZD8_9AGAR|nr:hypothetical protein D9758_018628 [Tetrapyrgos nigripes]
MAGERTSNDSEAQVQAVVVEARNSESVKSMNISELVHTTRMPLQNDQGNPGNPLLHHGTLQRKIKSRHITMISLGGVIGTGLFLNTATGLMNGGPLGLLLAYVFCSTIAFSVMLCLAEMLTLLPVQGGHVTLAERFVGRSWSFGVGWLYWLNWALVFPAELVACGVIIGYWDKETSSAVYIMVAFVICIFLNSFTAGFYGEAEFWFASIKGIYIVMLLSLRATAYNGAALVLTIVGVIILSIIVDAGGGPQGGAIGFRYWRSPGPFNQELRVLWAVSLASGLIVALAAGEAKYPRKNIPKSVKTVYIRICLFYVLGALCVGLLVSQDDPALNLGDSTAASSPFVIAFQRAGIEAVPHIVNGALLTAAWSAGNADVYTSSRALYGLALAGNAPKVFLKTTKRGLPWVALIPSAAFGLLGLMSLGDSAGTVFNYFVNLTSTAGLVCWFAIGVIYLRFQAGMKAQGLKREDLPYSHFLAPYAGWYTVFFTLLICLFSGFKNFIQNYWDAPTFVTNYLPLPLLPLFVLGHRLITRTPFVSAKTMDLTSEVAEFDKMEQEDQEREELETELEKEGEEFRTRETEGITLGKYTLRKTRRRMRRLCTMFEIFKKSDCVPFRRSTEDLKKDKIKESSQLKLSTFQDMSNLTTNDYQALSKRNKEYSYYMWYFTASFIGLLTLVNIFSIAFSKLPRRPDSKRNCSTSNERLALSRLPLALVNVYRVLAYRTTLNITKSFSINLAEVGVCAMYAMALFTLEFINTTSVAGESLNIDYWKDRAGIMAASQFPLIVALGMKNNIISLLTGIGYEKLSFIHRMVSRVVFVLLCVHVGGELESGYQISTRNGSFTAIGFMAFLAFAVLVFVVSNRFVRVRAYEFFFYGHIALALIVLGGAHYHTNERGYTNYIWPCFLLWGLDRFIRLLRMVAFNWHSFNSLSKANEIDASLELVTSDTVRLTVKRPSHFWWAPGQFVYLSAPNVSTFPLEGHPLTIARHRSLKPVIDLSSAGITTHSSDEESQKAALPATSGKKLRELTFLINVHDGFTKKLREAAIHNQTIKVLLDGPYGFPTNVDTSDTIILVAGGTGVTFTLPIFSDVILRVRSSKSRCKRLTFVWSVRDPAYIDMISADFSSLSNIISDSISVNICLFVTGGEIDSRPRPILFESVTTDEKLKDLVTVSSGRPDLPSILEDEIAQTRDGTVCVVSCGSQSVARAVRKSLGLSVGGLGTIMRGGASVTLHEETFGYA